MFCGADIISTLSSIWANKFSPDEICTLGLTNLIGGKSSNIIEEKMSLVGTLRFFNKQVGEKAFDIVKNTANFTGRIHGCKIVVNNEHKVSDPLINDNDLANFAQYKLDPILKENLVLSDKWYASESFRNYGEIAPYLYGFLGNKNGDKGIIAENHDPRFDIDDERTLPMGIKTMVLFTYYFLLDY